MCIRDSPYTVRLMSSTPGAQSRIDSLQPVPGNLPDLRRAQLPACRDVYKRQP